MEYKENINYKTEEISISITLTIPELVRINLSKTDRLLIDIAEQSNKVSSRILALEAIIKRIEERR